MGEVYEARLGSGDHSAFNDEFSPTRCRMAVNAGFCRDRGPALSSDAQSRVSVPGRYVQFWQSAEIGTLVRQERMFI